MAEPSGYHSWRSAWGIAAALLIVGFGVAGMIMLGRWALTERSQSAHPPASASTPVTTSRAAPTTSTPEQDRQYIQSLKEHGIAIGKPDVAMGNGRLVCDHIQDGQSIPEIVKAFRASNPELSGNADTYIAISVHTYCPQNVNLLPPGS